METVALPYKLQIFLSESLRQDLKNLAHARQTSLQKLVVEILQEAVEHDDTPERARRQAVGHA